MNDNIYVDRLRTLRDMVLETPNDNYNHGSFIGERPDNVCGTVGCTLGHAACRRDDLFPELQAFPVYNERCEVYDITSHGYGLRSAADDYFGEDVYEYIMDCGTYRDFSTEHDKHDDPDEDGKTRWSNEPLWDYLVKPSDVAKRIEEFVLWKYGVVL